MGSGTRRPAVVLMMLMIGTAIALPSGDAQAARSSKPREIVVVGSKVKDVVRSAGFRAEGNVVAALSARVLGKMAAAMDRAEKNGRYTLFPFDLSCPTPPDHGDVRMNKAQLIERLAKARGFELAPGVQNALNAYANQALSEGLHRAGKNKRGTVRPHDL